MFKKVVSSFTLLATLAVFSCSIGILWEEFSSHVLAQSETCSTQDHCIDHCIPCDVARHIFDEDQIRSTEEQEKDMVQNSNSSEPVTDVLVHLNNSPPPKPDLVYLKHPEVSDTAYALAHHKIENIVMIL